jgi:hypothetical protein
MPHMLQATDRILQSEKMTVMAILSFGSPPPNTILEIEPELAPVVNTKAEEPMTQVAVV